MEGTVGGYNLLRRLFRYRPRDGFTHTENFLTEAFAYTLESDASIQSAAIARLTEGAIEGASDVRVETQSQHRDEEGRRCIPDMIVYGREPSGGAFEIWVENKCESDLSLVQVSRYAAELARRCGAVRGHMAFMANNLRDVLQAAAHFRSSSVPNTLTYSSVRWADVRDALEPAARESTRDFCDFVDERGYGRLPIITTSLAQNYDRQRDRKDLKWGYTEDLRRFARRQCEAALAEMHHTLRTPALDGVSVVDGWGRIALLSQDEVLSVGMLHNPFDHRTQFLDDDQPLDIIVRLLMNPKNVRPAQAANARDTLAGLKADLEHIGFDFSVAGQGWNKNRYSALLGHLRRGYPWDLSTGTDQAKVLAGIFDVTWRVLNKPEHLKRIRKLPNWD